MCVRNHGKVIPCQFDCSLHCTLQISILNNVHYVYYRIYLINVTRNEISELNEIEKNTKTSFGNNDT